MNTLDNTITIILELAERKLVLESLEKAMELAKIEIARNVWEENKTQIMARMDLRGLASLIAIEASKELKK